MSEAHVYRCGHFHALRSSAITCITSEWAPAIARLHQNIAEGRVLGASASARVLFHRAQRAGLIEPK